ncbi:collagen alpha-1(I) chain-like [Choloepus didactylus]|uniref:collagen alpha-1(I) chain-like n=1 Tax=Choloepus didactylus TaxID=27675 RepID=UPI00189CB604|nr:collagen alpha-1(I) chain-like [Choloepus didactylus]
MSSGIRRQLLWPEGSEQSGVGAGCAAESDPIPVTPSPRQADSWLTLCRLSDRTNGPHEQASCPGPWPSTLGVGSPRQAGRQGLPNRAGPVGPLRPGRAWGRPSRPAGRHAREAPSAPRTAFQGENASQASSCSFLPASKTSCMISATRHPQPPPAPLPVLSGSSICKTDLGTLLLHRLKPTASGEVVGPSERGPSARGRQSPSSGRGRGRCGLPGVLRARRNLPGSFSAATRASWRWLGAQSARRGERRPGLGFSRSPQGGRAENSSGRMCGMCQAHLPTPGEGRGRGPAEGRGEGRGSGRPEQTCLFSCGPSPVVPPRCSACSPPRPAPPPPPRPNAPRPGPEGRCPPEGARAPAVPATPAPRAGHLCQVGLLSGHRTRPDRETAGAPSGDPTPEAELVPSRVTGDHARPQFPPPETRRL